MQALSDIAALGFGGNSSAFVQRGIPVDNVTGAYTLVAGDAGREKQVVADVTVPPSVFAIGDMVAIRNEGAVDRSLIQGVGVTLRVGGATTGANRVLRAFQTYVVRCLAANVFEVRGP